MVLDSLPPIPCTVIFGATRRHRHQAVAVLGLPMEPPLCKAELKRWSFSFFEGAERLPLAG